MIYVPRGNYDVWSNVPGPYGFNLQKKVTLYELVDATKENEIRLRTGPALNYTVTRNISWTEFIDSVRNNIHRLIRIARLRILPLQRTECA